MLRFLLQEFAQQKGLLREPLGTRVLGKKIKKLVPKYRRATWLEHHDWHPGFDLGSKRIQSPQQQFLGPVQHAKVIQWPPATQGCARCCHVKSRRFENVNRRLGGVRMEIVVEGIRPEHDLTWLVWRRVFDPPGRGGAPSPHRRYPPPEPFPECLPRKCRNLPLPRHSGNPLCNIPQQGSLCREVHQPRRHRKNSSPNVNIPERIRAARSSPAFVVVGQKFRLVRRQIHAHGAIALAAFAGEAEVEEVFYLLASPSFPHNFAFGHFPEQMGTPAG